MTDLSTLIERVRKATGPDRAIDRDIEEHILGTPFRSTIRGREWLTDSHGGVETWARQATPFTASVDAALGFAERMLPGWRYDLHSPRMGQIFEAVLMDGDGATRRIIVGHAATLPLAIVLATLLAIQSKGAS